MGKSRQELLELGEQFFEAKGWRVFPFQKNCWEAILRGENGLLNAPTGSGKTYALWLPFLLEHIGKHPNDYYAKDQKGLKVIWVTPLRALAQDIRKALQEMADDAGLNWEIAVRSGDTSSYERQKQKSKAPDALVTTPESLHMLFTHHDAEDFFKHVNGVVVDEWHELLGSKRGVQTELALQRIRKWSTKNLRIWGISATIGNLKQAKEVLLGPGCEGRIIKANIQKKLRIVSILPQEVEKFPWAGHLGIRLIPEVLPVILKSKSTLLFTNTRSQTELWYQSILTAAPELIGQMAMHHGSLEPKMRAWVEQAIAEGKLKLVVCTSSLDLGVDFRPVDTIIQVGGPKGVARFLQRAGRSGHRPGETSTIYFVPTHSLELVEAAALRQAIKKEEFEERPPMLKSMDVLVQYMTTIALGQGFSSEELYHEVKKTFSYQHLQVEEWQWALNFITTGGASLSQYDEFIKVGYYKGLYRVKNKRIALRHRLSIGTIVGDPVLKIRYEKGPYLGSIEESFVSKFHAGDVFWFAGQALALVGIKNMTVLVKKSNKKTGVIPRWMGGRMPLSSQLASKIREMLEAAANGSFLEKEMEVVRPILDMQAQLSSIPDRSNLLIEKVKTREGYHCFVYPFEGRLVHEILAGLLAYRLGKVKGMSFSMAMNDYGFELLSDQEIPIEEAIKQGLFSTENLMEEIAHSINKAEMAQRRFRDIATISGLIFQGFPGQNFGDKHLQSSSKLLYSVFQEYEPENLLIKQASEEVMAMQLEQHRLFACLEKIQANQINIQSPIKPTPFAFPILADRLRAKLSTESIADRIRKMQIQLEKQ